MSHFPTEAHLSTLSHSLTRLSTDEIAIIVKERESAIRRVMQSSCMEDRYLFGLPNKG